MSSNRRCCPSCPGWFVNSETCRLERCDECARFESDDHARAHIMGKLYAADADEWGKELKKSRKKSPTKFDVRLSCRTIAFATVTVEAADEEAAEDLALSMAHRGDVKFLPDPDAGSEADNIMVEDVTKAKGVK